MNRNRNNDSALLSRTGLNGKLMGVVLFSVLAAFAVLTVLVIRRETALLEADGKKNAEVLATTISTALRDNMLSGMTDDTVRLVRELSAIPGVADLTILAADGSRAFGLPGKSLDLEDAARWNMRNGFEATISLPSTLLLVKPLMNEQACRSCHPGTEAIRGAVVVCLSTAAISDNISDLAVRMALFGVIVAALLSALLIILGRKKIVTPLRSLTEAARRISLGEYVLTERRGVRCREILQCPKNACPSYDDDTIPCWLKSGTLCTGQPVGPFALKLGNCRECRVYRDQLGDEIRQLEDNFNRMSLTLEEKEAELKRQVTEVDGLNRELSKNNTKLTTLLDASKLMTSSLELDRILTDSMRIILNATSLKAGIILLLEEDLKKRCWEFFDCKAFNCPAYKASANCWQLSGTMCHGDATTCPNRASAGECWERRGVHTHFSPIPDHNGKVKACSYCAFFSTVVLIPKMTSGFHTDDTLGKKLRLDGGSIHRALVMGQAMVDHSGKNPFDLPLATATEIAMPLKMKEQMIGVFYLASDEKLTYDRQHIEFFQLLSEVISSGIFNSRLYDDMERSYLQTVGALANAVEAKDPYTRGHSERVANLSAAMADVLGLSRQEKEHLRFAALLHDVGKIGINRDIIRKEQRLDESEEKEMRSHPDKGAQILAPIHFLRPALSAIRHHHEHYDGTGYPDGIKGGEIPFKARILTVADAWDAMQSDRPYRKALSDVAAKTEMLRHAGTQFDPQVVDALIQCLPGVQNASLV